jgi:hypothetical protein
MPYTYYTKLMRADVIAIRAYLDTVKPVQNKVIANQLPFPFNQRETMIGWNRLYFTPRVQARPQQVGGMEPRRLSRRGRGALRPVPHAKERDGRRRGRPGNAGLGTAPNITGNRRIGVGDWTVEDIALYLKTGRNRYGVPQPYPFSLLVRRKKFDACFDKRPIDGHQGLILGSTSPLSSRATALTDTIALSASCC